MSSLEKQSPGISPRFFSQKMAQKEPEKKMPSTAANATMRSAKVALFLSVHRSAHSAFCITAGMVSIALNRCVFSSLSRMYVSMSSEYTSECTFSIAIWKPAGWGGWVRHRTRLGYRWVR
jgi:hypothetical protein